MSLPEPTRTFRDPIHGYVGVFDWENEIIDQPVFQRLRSIRQLGLTSYVYHGAEHSRFGHSIGVMHLAGRFVERLLKHPYHEELLMERQGWSERDFKAKVDQTVLEARLAGLLHDIGHSPFSHTGENRLFPEMYRLRDEQGRNLAWRLSARQHPKPVYETSDHEDRVVTDSLRRRLGQELSGRYPNVQVWPDLALDHPERFRTGDEVWPVRRDSGRWTSLTSLSRALAGLEPIRRFRIYAEVGDNRQLENEIRKYCREMA